MSMIVSLYQLHPYHFCFHLVILSLLVASHSKTPRRNGQTTCRRLPSELTPLLKTSPFISSMVTVGRPSFANHLPHMSLSTGCIGCREDLGVGRLDVECRSSKIPNVEF